MLAVAVVGLLVFVVVDRLLDTGARAYNADVPLYRVVIFLPPADTSPAEQRIEAAKARFREQEGERLPQPGVVVNDQQTHRCHLPAVRRP